jgi:hypothetical protein
MLPWKLWQEEGDEKHGIRETRKGNIAVSRWSMRVVQTKVVVVIVEMYKYGIYIWGKELNNKWFKRNRIYDLNN